MVRRPPEIEPIRWLMLSLHVPAALLALWWLLGPAGQVDRITPWTVLGWTPRYVPLGAPPPQPDVHGVAWRVGAVGLAFILVTHWVFLWRGRGWLTPGVPKVPDVPGALVSRRPWGELVVAALWAGLVTLGLVAALLDLSGRPGNAGNPALPGWWTRWCTGPAELRLTGPVFGELIGPWPRPLRGLWLWPVLAAPWLAWFAWRWRPADGYRGRWRVLRVLLVLGLLAAGAGLFVLGRHGADTWTMMARLSQRAPTIQPAFVTVMTGYHALALPPLGAAAGIVLGSVGFLWAWGGATYLRFQWERFWKLAASGTCLRCGYNLRGTLAAGRRQCPECGAAIDETFAEAHDE